MTDRKRGWVAELSLVDGMTITLRGWDESVVEVRDWTWVILVPGEEPTEDLWDAFKVIATTCVDTKVSARYCNEADTQYMRIIIEGWRVTSVKEAKMWLSIFKDSGVSVPDIINQLEESPDPNYKIEIKPNG